MFISAVKFTLARSIILISMWLGYACGVCARHEQIRIPWTIHEVLIMTCSAVSCRENEGPTPLRSASHGGHHDVVKLLVKKGAKVEPQDLMTAIDEGNE